VFVTRFDDICSIANEIKAEELRIRTWINREILLDLILSVESRSAGDGGRFVVSSGELATKRQ
jgi:hypothetical protein